MKRDGGGNAGEAGEAERRRRLDALSALSGQRAGQPAAPPEPEQRHEMPTRRASSSAVVVSRRGGSRAPRPAWQIIGAGALAICVVVVAALVAIHALNQQPTAPAAPDPLVVPVSRTGMSCLISASWSPNGKQIAALMTPNACNHAGGGALVLFDATLAHPGNPIALDQAILAQGLPQSVQQNPALMQQAGVAYYTLQWSPDSSQVAVLAGGPVPSATPDTSGPGDYFWALAVVNAQSGAVRVIAAPPEPSTAFNGDNSPYNYDSYHPVLAWRFDLTASTGTLARIPQALAYTWGADGSLTPSVPMPDQGAAPAAFVGPGLPWQTFDINQVFASCVMYYQIMLSASLWSPDGRYVVPTLYAHGLLANAPASAPTPTPQDTGGDTGSCAPQGDTPFADQLAPLQAPAVVTAAIGQVVSPDSTDLVGLRGLLSPTGKRLAAEPEGMPYAPWIARVYDVTSGKLRATITPEMLGQHIAVRSALDFNMLWSPDGARLLLTNSQTFYLLGARSLGG